MNKKIGIKNRKERNKNYRTFLESKNGNSRIINQERLKVK